jgi:Flp pilus assembly protein TadD
MTQKDIPQLLHWARADAGNGNYAKAAQEYRAILQLQPNNSDAREGLRKIQVAQGLDQ